MVRVALLCPSCAVRPVDTPAGWCTSCVLDRSAAAYAAEDHARAIARSVRWLERSERAAAPPAHGRTSDGPEQQRLRQQRHRLEVAIRPKGPVPADLDPWQIGAEALHRLARVRVGLPPSSPTRQNLEVAEEMIRWLAVGPGSEPVQR